MGVKRNLKRIFWSTRGKRIATSVVSGIVALSLIGTCLYIFIGDQPEYNVNDTKEEKEVVKKHQESDLQGLISGIGDRYVVVNAQGVDYFYNVQCNGEIIKYINVDDSKVNLSTPGSYEINYTVGAIKKKLAEHLKQEITASDDEIEDINITKTITVVTLEEAATLADAGTVVYADNNQQVAKTDGTVTEVAEEEIENATTPVRSDDRDDDDEDEDDNRNQSSNNNNSSNSNNNNNNTNNGADGNQNPSGGSQGDSQGGNNMGTTIPVHDRHDWVEVPGDDSHWETIEVCNGCGGEKGNHSSSCSRDPALMGTKDVYVVVVDHYVCSGCNATTKVPY